MSFIPPSGNVKFYHIAEDIYNQYKSNGSSLETNAIYLIYNTDNDKYKLAVGYNIVSGDSVIIENSGGSIINSSSNAVSGKAVLEAINATAEVVKCMTEADYNNAIASDNMATVGKLIYLADDMAQNYRLTFKLSSAKLYDLIIETNDEYNASSTDFASHLTIADALKTIFEKGVSQDGMTENQKLYANDSGLYYRTSTGLQNLLTPSVSFSELEEVKNSNYPSILDTLLKSNARDFLLPANGETYLTDSDTKVVISAEKRIQDLESKTSNYLLNNTSNEQSISSNLTFSPNTKLTVDNINDVIQFTKENESINKIQITNVSVECPSLKVNGSIEASSASIGNIAASNISTPSLTLNNAAITSIPEGIESDNQSGSNVPGIDYRLKIGSNIVLTKEDLTATNGLIAEQLTTLNTNLTTEINTKSQALSQSIGNEVTRAKKAEATNASAINNFLFIGNALPTENTENIKLWIDTSASTNGVIKYRTIKEENGVQTEKWIAVNAVWG